MDVLGVWSWRMKKFHKNLLRSEGCFEVKSARSANLSLSWVENGEKSWNITMMAPKVICVMPFAFVWHPFYQHNTAQCCNFTSCGSPMLSIVCHCEHNRVILLDQISEIAATDNSENFEYYQIFIYFNSYLIMRIQILPPCKIELWLFKKLGSDLEKVQSPNS